MPQILIYVMTKLRISNIGPVKDLEFSLNKINVFIGPQGSGKSTVAKILSFCLWLEKDCIKRQTTTHLDNDSLKSLLIDYHNMKGYFSDYSYFRYDGDAICIEYVGSVLHIQKQEEFHTAPLSKNAYIPAERNILSVPGIFSTKMPDNYIHDFIADWLDIRTKYRNGGGVNLLGAGQNYTFDDTDNSDYIVSSGTNLKLPLSQVSSGLQSVTPICVMIDYLTKWIYSHHEERSPEDRRILREAAIARFMKQKNGYADLLDNARQIDSLKETISNLSETIQTALEMIDKGLDIPTAGEFKDLISSLGNPSFSNIVIEEPELNLFPTTQVRLLYFILSNLNHSRDNLVVTTHSPYILYALNNCILAGMVAADAEYPIDQVADIPDTAYIHPAIVSVWELEEGGIRGNKTIQDERGLIRDNYFDQIMNNVMVDFRNMVNFL